MAALWTLRSERRAVCSGVRRNWVLRLAWLYVYTSLPSSPAGLSSRPPATAKACVVSETSVLCPVLSSPLSLGRRLQVLTSLKLHFRTGEASKRAKPQKGVSGFWFHPPDREDGKE